MNDNTNVAAVIVTYHPDLSELEKLIQVLICQVGKIYIVDNGSSTDLRHLVCSNITLSELNENMGIAYAQNIGISKAKSDEFKDVILFDQDSLPSLSLVSDLLFTRERARSSGCSVGAVGPVHIDTDSRAPGLFIATRNNKLHKINPNNSKQDFFECDFLIASGCLISMDILDRIGLMEEGLFIDCVDMEWGFRLKNYNYSCVVAKNAKMYHKIGDKPLIVFGRYLTIHSPLRHYYFYRNFHLLRHRDYIPSPWKKYVLIKSTLQALVFSTLLPNRYEHFKKIMQGICDARRGKYGKY
ncbi:glycosyltransferase family 2 protein [Vibrio hangzhouensis]|uniref:Rhamnosyltransferase n=1 Tax=Vibrio hangzhouensis TaxID=462991 RepID=A0A1H6BZZ3_9VIBR|nr:glycosyltransferase family 2 protein [Vibrio hangzhouensis]SEG66271.1 rhamnosyltransferase [Vibrio hangzhouensis]